MAAGDTEGPWVTHRVAPGDGERNTPGRWVALGDGEGDTKGRWVTSPLPRDPKQPPPRPILTGDWDLPGVPINKRGSCEWGGCPINEGPIEGFPLLGSGSY